MRFYIHIPFCVSKCSYCSFASVTNQSNVIKYFEALNLDLERFLPLKNNIKSIYFGGGTPSLINAKYYKNIFDKFKNYIDNETEISIEANPNSLTYEWIQNMLDYGVNRISLGVQSFNDKKLLFLNRAHTSKIAIEKIMMLKKIGVNFSIDIIYGTFLDDKKMLDDELSAIKNLNINHLSAYTLILENNTPFANKTEFLQKNDELNCYFYNELNNLGLKAYEISNFATNIKYECNHNKAYWNKENYIGLGLSSVGTTELKRFYASNDLIEYIKNPTKRICETLSLDDNKFEKIFLGLRSSVGVDINLVDINKLKILENDGLIKIINNRFYNNNYLLSDEIALFIS